MRQVKTFLFSFLFFTDENDHTSQKSCFLMKYWISIGFYQFFAGTSLVIPWSLAGRLLVLPWYLLGTSLVIRWYNHGRLLGVVGHLLVVVGHGDQQK